MEKLFRYFAAIALAVILPSIAFAEEIPRVQIMHRLSGIVVDSATREPIIGASVVLEPLGVGKRTGRDGRFEFATVRAGKYALHIRSVGYLEEHLEIDLRSEVQLSIQLRVRAVEGKEIVVRGELERDAIDQMEGSLLEQERGQTLGETLEHISGVTKLQTGASISKPVIRGLHSQRITVLNAGVVQEGQQWGAEHGPEIDPFSPTSIEVIKGAASVEYGAGAIGGVIRIVPRELPHEGGVRGNLALNGFSNNVQTAGSFMLEGGLAALEGFGWRAQVSSRYAGDSRTPDYVLGNTAFRELNGSLALGLASDDAGLELFASHFGSEIGIFLGSHIGSRADLIRAIERGRPATTYNADHNIEAPKQTVDHELLSLGGHIDVASLGKLEAHYGLQHNDRSEFEKHRDPAKPDRRSMRLKLLTHSVDLKLQHDPIGSMTGSIGINALRQGNTGEGFDLLIPNYLTYAGGIFLLEQLALSDRLMLKAGARYDHNQVDVFALPAKEVERAEHTFSSVSGALGMSYDVDEYWSLAANLATAWRPPSINELYSNGVHHGSAQYERGDPDLTTERSINSELILRMQTPGFGFEAAAYVNSLNGFITLAPQPEPVITVSGAYPSFKYQQTDARLLGAELTLNLQINEELSSRMTAAIVRGRDILSDAPLFGMPAERAELELSYLLPDWRDVFQASSISVSTLAVARQMNAPTGDYADPPAGYLLLNSRLSTHVVLLGQPIDLYLEARNILDHRYRDYLSRYRYFADDPGRNFILRLSLPFGNTN
ncbi:MAG TPA: TonB-dependent receptor [Candidatus Kapabacteria bacterium]|nr:TonB-dependent receptor [Candidatus Kapabacteria bacterium]